MSSDFEQATALRRATDGGDSEAPVGDAWYSGEVPDGWQQGRGAFGGIVVGSLTRAIVSTEPDASRRLRSLSADLCAPALPGPFEVCVSTLRRGASVSFFDARFLQGGALVARASAALGAARPVSPVAIEVSPPVRPPYQGVAIVPIEPPLGPVFAKRYEYRSTGPVPFSGGKEAVAEGWVREKGASSAHDEASMAALLDAFWPAMFAIEPRPRAITTMGYTMQLLVDPRTLDASEPLFYRGRDVATGDNFFVEMRELWSGDSLVAMNQQTFAVLT